MSRDDYAEVECIYKHNTADAVRIVANEREFWVPFRHMHIASENTCKEASKGDEITLKIREWLLKREGVL